MQYFTEQAYSHREALDKIRDKYGEKAKILTHRSIRLGGFLGLFTREGVEFTGYISADQRKNKILDQEEEKKKIINSVRNEQTMQQLLKEVQSIKQKIDGQVPNEREQHPSLDKIEKLLIENDFTPTFIRSLLVRLKEKMSLHDLDNFTSIEEKVVEWIGEKIKIHHEKFFDKPKILILVGPTGVGKTTTIAKLAAVHGIGNNGDKPKKVRMITIDNYRIGARQQIETYGDIMGIPVACVETFQDLKKKIALYQDVDLILIDTVGKSPRDYMKLAEMRELLDACGTRAEVYLAVSATTKTIDLKEILQQFEPFDYKAVVLTKMDETMHIGNIISVLSEKDKPLAYFTDGQVVPQDIECASATSLLMHLEGLRVNQERINTLFGKNGSTGARSTEVTDG